ncbi:Re/Si-specific NAD(P)(+) transhydrogenase subunit alpha [Streptomyces sp. RKND-216]|uniref:Re/Si-specific NAD(P)(+) transhydrogenase subunit alpha n=1 Tax=Streptomyces sp. RKND-216 TaxID=2562581 RepID=UPI00109DDFCB|nr:Re/Si-specific NAD(P)(+) transhydrogenase subunit alpha [Streptomyces sp. RKND-216]THA26013.1 Re/Si-specific NAD(P)(+) transhydrogenase subunit alpha [Streptomyces sp. RKND-216]
MSAGEENAPGARAARVGVPRERGEGERRVALVPKVIEKLRRTGVEVVVESGAGIGALIPDAHFTAAGARIGDPWACDVVVKVAPPTAEETARLGRGSALIGFLAPLTSPETVTALRDAGVTGFAMEAVPRISRAQSMDALSSQANVSGYKAVLLAADHCTRFFPMLTTAAGTVKPATALVLGVGVAGLQALATAKRLGARTTGYDVRPEVADQVRSLGAQWLDLGIDAAGEGGYARELSEAERAEQLKRLEEAITGFDVVITTALVPGRKAPRLVTARAVEGMRPGSVVVDLAGEAGGNCELTEPGEVVVRYDVTVASPLNLPARMPEHSSELYARNVSALLELMLDENGAVVPDWSDDVLAASCVTRSGTSEGAGGSRDAGGSTKATKGES